jgi:hypothetical protein
MEPFLHEVEIFPVVTLHSTCLVRSISRSFIHKKPIMSTVGIKKLIKRNLMNGEIYESRAKSDQSRKRSRETSAYHCGGLKLHSFLSGYYEDLLNVLKTCLGSIQAHTDLPYDCWSLTTEAARSKRIPDLAARGRENSVSHPFRQKSRESGAWNII